MRRLALVATLTLALVVAACGGDDDNTTPSAATGTTKPALSGAPIRLGAIVDSVDATAPQKDVKAAMQAAIDDVNANGGVKGRPLQIGNFCDTKLDANSTEKCARDIVADQGIVATVGNFMNFGESADGILTDAHMASVGNLALTSADYQCTVCFPTSSGSFGILGGEANLVNDVLGQKPINIAITDVPAAHQLAPAISGILASHGSKATIGKTIYIPVGQADMSSFVATAASGDPQAIMVAMGGGASKQFVQTARTQGVTLPIAASNFQFTPPDIKALGDAAEGMYLSAYYPLTGPGPDKFAKTMSAIDPAYIGAQPAMMWVAVHMFADVARKLDTIDRAAVLDAMSHLTGYDTDGFTPPLDFTKNADAFGGHLPRMFNLTIVYAQVKNGKIVQLDSDFHNVFAPGVTSP